MIVSHLLQYLLEDFVKQKNEVILLPYKNVRAPSNKLRNGIMLTLMYHNFHYGILSAEIEEGVVTRVILMSSLVGNFSSYLEHELEEYVKILSRVGYRIDAAFVTLVEFDQEFLEPAGESNNLCGIFALMFASNLVHRKPLYLRVTVSKGV